MYCHFLLNVKLSQNSIPENYIMPIPKLKFNFLLRFVYN